MYMSICNSQPVHMFKPCRRFCDRVFSFNDLFLKKGQKSKKKMLHFATSFVYIIERDRMSDKTLTTVFTKMRRKFLNMAMAILPNEEDAADALQESPSGCIDTHSIVFLIV